jgi:hypothetical protein
MAKCYGCMETIFYEDMRKECSVCNEIFHLSCVSEENEDGVLCTTCGRLCSGCNMIIRIQNSVHKCAT